MTADTTDSKQDLDSSEEKKSTNPKNKKKAIRYLMFFIMIIVVILIGLHVMMLVRMMRLPPGVPLRSHRMSMVT